MAEGAELPNDPAARPPAGNPVTPLPGTRLPARAETPAPLGDEVVEATKRGETWAWEAAYQAYARGLTGFLVLRLGNRDDAAEALSETFLRAIDRAESLRGGAESFRAWLFRIARNVANDRLRIVQRTPRGDHDVDPADLVVPNADDRIIAAEDAGRVRQALMALEPDDREVLWLRVCARLSSAEVGEIVGKRPGAVRMQQQRALANLARLMGESP
ncbi:MAG TPA: sigma-70 family RNA polymerase sigma factor [Acidimicrobiales bacterium]|nr:sigma-70 family RNA polymerase sigma factor [Acidimicrobiales bacterium]